MFPGLVGIVLGEFRSSGEVPADELGAFLGEPSQIGQGFFAEDSDVDPLGDFRPGMVDILRSDPRAGGSFASRPILIPEAVVARVAVVVPAATVPVAVITPVAVGSPSVVAVPAVATPRGERTCPGGRIPPIRARPIPRPAATAPPRPPVLLPRTTFVAAGLRRPTVTLGSLPESEAIPQIRSEGPILAPRPLRAILAIEVLARTGRFVT